MKQINLALFLISFPALLFAQNENRPIIDSTVACSYYNQHEFEFFYIVERMPIPKINLDELEKTIQEEVRLNEQEKALNGTMYFQCVVNCKGNARDFQVP